LLGAGIGASCPEKPLRSCSMSELVETSRISATNTGRWLVTEKMIDRNYSNTTQVPISEPSYETGEQSLGFTMDYFPTTCSLLSMEDLKKAKKSCFERRNSTRPLTIVMVGDSNFNFQSDYLQGALGGEQGTAKIHRVSTLGPFDKTQDTILKELDELAKKPDQDYVLLFNIGLHEFITCNDVISCPQRYREHLTTLATAVQKFPAILKVWQNTQAAWPKVSKILRRIVAIIGSAKSLFSLFQVGKLGSFLALSVISKYA
jgi:hypothetical protein